MVTYNCRYICEAFFIHACAIIIAENPDMKANEAITLSRKMMKGYKWRAFLYGLSFIGWTVIGMATLGVVGVLFVNL
ncbi:MAG: DUF975 family protein [Lachnospira eligens]